jgi:hypothetical protein
MLRVGGHDKDLYEVIDIKELLLWDRAWNGDRVYPCPQLPQHGGNQRVNGLAWSIDHAWRQPANRQPAVEEGGQNALRRQYRCEGWAGVWALRTGPHRRSAVIAGRSENGHAYTLLFHGRDKSHNGGGVVVLAKRCVVIACTGVLSVCVIDGVGAINEVAHETAIHGVADTQIEAAARNWVHVLETTERAIGELGTQDPHVGAFIDERFD